MRGVQDQVRRGVWLIVPLLLASLGVGCVSVSDGPPRLYPIEVETQRIREGLVDFNFVRYAELDDAQRVKYRNDWIAARMYAIDIQYTAYEAALTQERQKIAFGAAATTLGLTTASGLVGPAVTKNLLTGIAGFVTGSKAAYDDDVLLAHSMQWIQSQMQAKRALIAQRILLGVKRSMADYPLAAALSDIEAYYRAGTFTGGILSTGEVLAADAQAAEDGKVTVISTPYTADAAKAAILAFWMPGDVVNEQNEEKLRKALATFSKLRLERIMNGEGANAKLRLQLAQRMGLVP